MPSFGDGNTVRTPQMGESGLLIPPRERKEGMKEERKGRKDEEEGRGTRGMRKGRNEAKESMSE